MLKIPKVKFDEAVKVLDGELRTATFQFGNLTITGHLHVVTDRVECMSVVDSVHEGQEWGTMYFLSGSAFNMVS